VSRKKFRINPMLVEIQERYLQTRINPIQETYLQTMEKEEE
jgi:hypothetical protein